MSPYVEVSRGRRWRPRSATAVAWFCWFLSGSLAAADELPEAGFAMPAEALDIFIVALLASILVVIFALWKTLPKRVAECVTNQARPSVPVARSVADPAVARDGESGQRGSGSSASIAVEQRQLSNLGKRGHAESLQALRRSRTPTAERENTEDLEHENMGSGPRESPAIGLEKAPGVAQSDAMTAREQKLKRRCVEALQRIKRLEAEIRRSEDAAEEARADHEAAVKERDVAVADFRNQLDRAGRERNEALVTRDKAQAAERTAIEERHEAMSARDAARAAEKTALAERATAVSERDAARAAEQVTRKECETIRRNLEKESQRAESAIEDLQRLRRVIWPECLIGSDRVASDVADIEEGAADAEEISSALIAQAFACRRALVPTGDPHELGEALRELSRLLLEYFATQRDSERNLLFSAEDALAAVNNWKLAFDEMRDKRFSIEIPSLGAPYDDDTMEVDPTQPLQGSKIRQIRSWCVYVQKPDRDRPYAIKAEVE